MLCFKCFRSQHSSVSYQKTQIFRLCTNLFIHTQEKKHKTKVLQQIYFSLPLQPCVEDQRPNPQQSREQSLHYVFIILSSFGFCRGRTLSTKVRKRAHSIKTKQWLERRETFLQHTGVCSQRRTQLSPQKLDGSCGRCSLGPRCLRRRCLRAVLTRCYNTDVRSHSLFIPSCLRGFPPHSAGALTTSN